MDGGTGGLGWGGEVDESAGRSVRCPHRGDVDMTGRKRGDALRCAAHHRRLEQGYRGYLMQAYSSSEMEGDLWRCPM